MKKLQLLIKYLLDFLVALIFVAPVSLVVGMLGAILVCDSPGPVFFFQPRLGKGGRLFRMIKLRTMVPGDHTGETPRNADGSLALTADTAGYTRFGKILRRFSLDELPQIYNILKGEMSFIGPRPDLPEHRPLYNDRDTVKLEVRPGLSGLAQISGRNELPWKERLILDAQYVGDYSLALDFKIAVITLGRLLTGHGVYQSKGK